MIGVALTPPGPSCKAMTMPNSIPNPGTDWRAASTPELVAHLVAHHHAYARQALTHLEAQLETAVKEQGGRPSPLGQVTVFFRELQQDLLAHFAMEEGNLFPAIVAMMDGGPAPIALSTPRELLLTIEAEHQTVEELFLNIRMVTADYELPPEPAPGLDSLYQGFLDLEDDLHRHLYLENHVLYPRVLGQGLA